MFDIGSSLREARIRQDLDFPELEERTKIRPKYLRALEDERFDILPAPTYVRGFLRSYAESLGLDGQPFVDEYNSRFTVGEDDAPLRARRVPPPRRDRAPRESRLAAVALVAIAIATALVIAAWKFGGPESPDVPGLAHRSGRGHINGEGEGDGTARRARERRQLMDGSAPDVRGREAALQRHTRAGSAEVVRGEEPPARTRRAAERARPAERESCRPSERFDVRRDLAEDPPGDILSRPRAAIVATGSELVRGERQDRNGPFLAAEVVRLGLEPASIRIVGDGVDDLENAFREALSADLCLVSGGLGPTHDDRTVELVAQAAGRQLVVDEELEAQIGSVSRTIAERLGRSYDDFAPGVRKQATRPEGSVSLGLAGTAPGLVLDLGDCVVVVLPGPPRELQRLWPRALETDAVRRVLARAPGREHHVLRFFGTPESAVAEALAAAGGEGDGVEVTICAREFEIHVDLFVDQGAELRGAHVAESLRTQLAMHLFGEDERSVAEIVLDLCRTRDLKLATAESCTGGMVAARLTAIPGASDVFVGSIVAYANEVKEASLGVPARVIEEHGAVSAEAAAAMAHGLRERLGADVGVAVTGVAGPGGGTAEKPVGLVFAHAVGPDGEKAVRTELPGDRDMIRGRATAASLHLVRRLLESRHTAT